MHQAVQQTKVGEFLTLHYLPKVELYVGLTAHELGIPKDPENKAVGNNAP